MIVFGYIYMRFEIHVMRSKKKNGKKSFIIFNEVSR